MRTSSDSLPDHSVLFRTFDISIFYFKSNEKERNKASNTINETKKRLEKINDDFFISDENRLQVQNTILKRNF